MAYKPKAIDTSNVEIPKDIQELTELISKNTHEVWANQRLQEGWRYGEKRDEDKKEHPCLIPYEELSEIEKNYDRRTSLETIKVILALGYEIKKR
ncbi:RyR domain-containing protein [Bacillus luti]|uniref:RyR domain-containing protein n=1 Tax=Bacillus luti TaxID=2026191 RepID=UPI00289716DE|nr:RyR domain-containing protein [Bacillus luti]MDA1524734.1 RyR domain-containing protein [Bacillus cereus]MDA1610013.1 RyR domain-containing protein [Bacillus cereus]